MKNDTYYYFFENNLSAPNAGNALCRWRWEVNMFVLLPKQRFGVRKMLANLDGKQLLNLIRKRRRVNVEVEKCLIYLKNHLIYFLKIFVELENFIILISKIFKNSNDFFV